MRPRPDDTDGLVGEFDTGERTALPLTGPQRGVGRRDLPGDREQQRDGMLGGGDDVRLRGVDDQHTAGGGRGNVDVVQTDARPGDHLQHRCGGQGLGVHGGGGPDQHRIGVGQGRQQRRPVGAVDMPDLEFGPEDVHRGLGKLLGDQHDGLGHSSHLRYVGGAAVWPRAGGSRRRQCVGRLGGPAANAIGASSGDSHARWYHAVLNMLLKAIRALSSS